jgi:PEP-CTERM motif
MRHLVLAVSVAAAGLFASSGAHALACSATGDVSPDAADCYGYVGGNDSFADMANVADNIENWDETYGWNSAQASGFKDDNSGSGSTTVLFDGAKNGDESTGTLTFLQALTGDFILALKGGNEVAYYYFDNANFAANSTIIFDIPGVQGAGYSHGTIYTSTPAIPEPSTYALMFAGLAAVGFMARRRRQN